MTHHLVDVAVTHPLLGVAVTCPPNLYVERHLFGDGLLDTFVFIRTTHGCIIVEPKEIVIGLSKLFNPCIY